MNANDGVNYNSKHKDTLFRKLFGENKENALSLYNARGCDLDENEK